MHLHAVLVHACVLEVSYRYAVQVYSRFTTGDHASLGCIRMNSVGLLWVTEVPGVCRGIQVYPGVNRCVSRCMHLPVALGLSLSEARR